MFKGKYTRFPYEHGQDFWWATMDRVRHLESVNHRLQGLSGLETPILEQVVRNYRALAPDKRPSTEDGNIRSADEWVTPDTAHDSGESTTREES